jgi:RNA polymerase sigma factor (sigma-70 family)
MPSLYNDIDDNTLLEYFYADKNNKWLGILLQRYTSLLLGVCMKYLKNETDAKDAVQQVFLKAINELQKYKVDYFKSWIYMVAKNHCLMQLRNKGKYSTELSDNILIQDDTAESKEKSTTKENSLNDLEKALLLLNEEQSICVTLFYLQKKSYNDIVGCTNYSLLQVKSNIQNGKRNLKIIMQSMHNNEQ